MPEDRGRSAFSEFLKLLPAALLLIPASSLAETPAISNAQALHVGKGYAGIYWESTEVLFPQGSSTLSGSMGTADIGTVQTIGVADGTSFPPGAVLKIGREYVRVAASSGPSLTVTRGYDYQQHQFSVVNGGLKGITVSGGMATAETTRPHHYETGQRIQVVYSNPENLSSTYAITVTGNTTFTFPTTAADGVYSNAALTARTVPEAHSRGDAVYRAGNDSVVCYGTDANYGHSEQIIGFVNFVQTYQHFIGLGGLLPGTTYHYRVLSTPYGMGTSNCASPGPLTAASPDLTFTTLADLAGNSDPAPPAATSLFDTSAPAVTGTSVTVAPDCADLQSAINTLAAADGDLTHQILIPANAVCYGNWILPLKSGPHPNGSGWIVIRSAASDDRLPPEGIRMKGDWYQSSLPKLYAPSKNSFFGPVFRMANQAHHYRLQELEMSTDPAASAFNGAVLVTTMSDEPADYLDPANQSSYLIVDRAYIHGQDNNSAAMGVRLACNFCAVIDSEITNIGTRANEGGAVQLDNSEGNIQIINNRLEASAEGGFFASDNSTIPTTDVSNVVIQRNYITKRRSWKVNAPEFASQVMLPVIAAVRGSSLKLTTNRDFEFQTGDTVSFSGGTGDWAALNKREFLTSTGTLLSIGSQAGTATVHTSAAHLLSPGKRIRVNGMLGYPCRLLNGETSVVSVPDATSFTYSTSAPDAAFCNSSDAQVLTVYPVTRIDGRNFSIPVDGSGWTDLSGQTLTVSYSRQQITKNTFEIKAGRRFLVEGNVIENSFSQDQAGWLMAITVRGLDMFNGWPSLQECGNCGKTIQDILIQNNVFQGACTWLDVLGNNTNGPSDNLRRVKLFNNLVTDVSDYWAGAFISGAPATCYGTGLVTSRAFEDLTLDHNTVVTGTGIMESSAPPGTRLNLTNNVLRFGFRGIANDVSGSGAAAWRNTVINGHKFAGNIMWGDRCAFRGINNGNCQSDDWGFQKQYYNGDTDGTAQEFNSNYWARQQEIGFRGVKPIVDATNTAPIVVTTSNPHGCSTGDRVLIAGATGNDAMNGFWTIETRGPSTFALTGSNGNGAFAGVDATALPLTGACADLGLSPSSVFHAGAPDGRDVGADMSEIQKATGKAALRSIQWGTNSVTLQYSAPAGETCYTDLSADGFASTPLRTADSAARADRTVVIAGISPGTTAYSYRLQCRSFQFAGVSTPPDAGSGTPPRVRGR